MVEGGSSIGSRVTLPSRDPDSFVLHGSFHMQGRVPLGVRLPYLQDRKP